MGYVLRLKRNQLVGGNNNDEIYPITATNAVYREGGKNLEEILNELGNSANGKKVTSVSYSKQDNSMQVNYSNGDVNNYTLPNCVEAVTFDSEQLIFTKIDGTETTVTIPKPITIIDKDATLNYSQRTNIATIGGTDIHVTLPDKPTYDVKIEFYDISVSNELEFFRAVAISWGYPVSNISRITNCSNTSLVTSLYSGGTAINVRIHLTADISIESCHTYNLQYCQTINGNSYKISFKNTITLKGRGCNFEKVKFSFNCSGSVYAFSMDSDLGAHSKYYFNMCQFAGCMMYPYSGNNTGFVKFAAKNSSTSNSLYLTACSFNANNDIRGDDTATESSVVSIKWLGTIGAAFVYIISNVSLPYNVGSGTNTNKFKIEGTSGNPTAGGAVIRSKSANVTVTGFTGTFDNIES